MAGPASSPSVFARVLPAPPSVVPLAFFAVLLTLYLLTASAYFLLLRMPMPPDASAELQLDTALLFGLGVAYAVWVLAASRSWLRLDTGAGFVVASSALAARLLVELPVAWAHALDGATVPEPYATWVVRVRLGATIAFALGLALVVSASLLDRRARHLVPHRAPTGASPDASAD